MTLRTDVARSRDLLACWRELAEERLEYLTQMFESGRWRRYYSEYAFLENIKEAKIAVETWRSLSAPNQPRNAAISISWFAPERAARFRKSPPRPEPSAVRPPLDIPVVIPAVATVETVVPEEERPAPVVDMFALESRIDRSSEGASNTRAGERYPLLRSTF
jgi:uncharacterized repeat protein (TIGR03809 family)